MRRVWCEGHPLLEHREPHRRCGDLGWLVPHRLGLVCNTPAYIEGWARRGHVELREECLP